MGGSIELFSLAARTYARVGAGEEIPRLEAPVFVRVRNEGP